MSQDRSDLPLIIIAGGTFPDPDRVVEHYRDRCRIRFADLSSPETTAAATAGSQIVVVATQAMREEILRAFAPSVKVIGRTGVGLDTVDLVCCAELGISVVNQPAYGATEVAVQAMAMLLTLQRKLSLSDSFVRRGWTGGLTLTPMRPLDQGTLGLLGCGRIGAETARLARPLVSKVLVYDPYATGIPDGVERVERLDDLLAASDLLSIHVPLTPSTRGMVGREQLALLPEGAVVVNVARGGIVDEQALADALISGHLGGAGLDVFAEEPLPLTSPLLGAPNTVFSPHVAAYSDRSIWRLASWTIEDCLDWLDRRGISFGNVAVAGSR
jgi:D-3-phosphoglycerate dehydrogenase